MPFGTIIKELKNKADTSKSGSRWTIEEHKQLLEELKNNKPYEDIAIDHKRTVTAIKARVVCNIIILIYNIDEIESKIDEISEKYNIEPEIISRYVKKQIIYNENIKEVKNNKYKPSSTIESRLENIENLLNKLNEQIDKITNHHL
jgi:hypothetical protein